MLCAGVAFLGGMVTGGLMGGGKYAGTQAINWVGSRHNNGTNIERDGFYEFGREETSGTQGTHREAVWSETRGANRGGLAGNSGSPSEIGRAAEYQTDPTWSSGTNQAAQIISDLGGEYVVEPDEQIRSHVNGPAYTSGGVTHLSNKIDSKLGITVANHERIHQLKQTGNRQYNEFVDGMSQRMNRSSLQTDYVLTILSKARFQIANFMELSAEQQLTVLDELNALVYGYYKDNAANAKSHFGEVFYDYDSHVAELDSIVNAASKSGSAAQGSQPSLPASNSNSGVSPFADIKHSLSKSQEVQKLSSVAHTFQERQALDRYRNAVDLLENRQWVLTDTQNRLQQLASTGDTRSAAYTKLKSAELELKRKVDDAQRKVDRLGESASIRGLREKAFDNVSEYDIIGQKEITIGRSVGAKAKNYNIELPNGEIVHLTEGTRVSHIKLIAGKGRDRQIDELPLLIANWGGRESEWQKMNGFGYVDYEGESYLVELHWYEEPTAGKHKWKVKPDAYGNWFVED